MACLKVASFDFSEPSNCQLHRTDKYRGVQKSRDVVLRRGAPFTIQFNTIDRDFDIDCDTVRIVFSFGPDPKTPKNTKGVVTVNALESSLGKSWGCRLQSQSAGSFQVKVTSPADIPVGLWVCHVETAYKSSRTKPTHLAKPVYFLFNPWCKDDQVYMPDEDLLDEYVLNDVGKIWVGAYGSCRGREWVFGQFDKYALPACMLLLERTNLRHMDRGNPVLVSRAISKLVNANDDKGVLVGKWSAPYTGGVAPSAWTGSTAILKQFVVTGQEVYYGQCWVFAGVLTTVCRALGLPSRVVSNLVSGHDTNASLTIDRYYDEDLNAVSSEIAEDSIWNFHVWNDVWMARPDLPAGYGGWQAVDATPQEPSEGFFQCGPTSLRAIKAGEISYRYDGAFLYASVNADIIRWKEDSSTDLGYIRIDTFHDHVGKMILTKKPFLFDCNGDRDREDITNQYKHEEGSAGERLVVYNAVGQNTEAKRYYEMPNKKKSDVEFELVQLERIMIGENYSICLKIKNKSKEERTVKALLTSTSVFYTGIPAEDVKTVAKQCILSPGSKEELSTTVTASEYLPHLVEYGIMKISAICSVSETNQTWADEDDFQVLKPSIKIEILDKCVERSPSRIKLSFTNPLKLKLSDCFFTLEAAGCIKAKIIRIGDVNAEDEVETVHSVFPKAAGKFHLVATFMSDPLHDVTGSLDFKVKASA